MRQRAGLRALLVLTFTAVGGPGCGVTDVSDLFAATPSASADSGWANGGGSPSGGAAGTGGTNSGGDAGTGGIAQTGGDAGTGGIAQTGGAGAGGVGSTCDPACTQRPGCPDPSCWTATADPAAQSASLAIDGKEGTRYTTNALAAGGEWLQVDICETRLIAGVNLYTAGATDVAASYTVEVSMDGTTWDTVVTSTTHATQRMAITFDPVSARLVRFTQTGRMNFWWSVGELSVVCQ